MKIGLVLGLVLAVAAVLWLATRPSLSPMARMSHAPDSSTAFQDKFTSPNVPLVTEENYEQNKPQTIGPQSEPVESAQHEQTEKIKTQKFHIVLKGQTLTSISKDYYGSAGKWQKIYDYNRKIIKDPNTLIPGTKLIIPN